MLFPLNTPARHLCFFSFSRKNCKHCRPRRRKRRPRKMRRRPRKRRKRPRRWSARSSWRCAQTVYCLDLTDRFSGRWHELFQKLSRPSFCLSILRRRSGKRKSARRKRRLKRKPSAWPRSRRSANAKRRSNAKKQSERPSASSWKRSDARRRLRKTSKR